MFCGSGAHSLCIEIVRIFSLGVFGIKAEWVIGGFLFKKVVLLLCFGCTASIVCGCLFENNPAQFKRFFSGKNLHIQYNLNLETTLQHNCVSQHCGNTYATVTT